MKTTIFCSILFQSIFYNILFGQLDWANVITSDNNDIGNVVKVRNNEIVVAGRFRNTADFDFGAGTFNLTSNGSDDMFIAKYDVNENLIWAISMGGPNGEEINDLVIDNSGNIYVTGRFQSQTIDMDPGPGVSNITSTSGATQWDIFVAKYSPTGAHLWSFGYGTNNIAESGNGIDLDNDGNVYVTGIFRGTIDFDPGAGVANLTPNGNGDVFVAKYNSNGQYISAFNIGAPGSNTCAGQDIRFDPNGFIYVGGDYEGTVDFDPGPGTTTLTGGFIIDGFVAKYDLDGNFQWVVGLSNDSQNRVLTLEVEPVSGAVFVGGFFQASVDFDPLGTANVLASPTGSSPYLARYNSNGTLNWVRQFSGSSSSNRSISLDNNGVLWCTGAFSNTVDFDFPNGFNLTSAGSSDIFVGRYNANSGAMICVERAGASGLDQGSSIAFVNNTSAVYTGYFSGTVDFDPGPGTVNLTAVGTYAIPVVKMNNTCSVFVDVLEASIDASQTQICAGDSIVFTDASQGAVTSWTWTFDGGLPATSNAEGPHTVVFNNPGSYTISLEVSNGSSTSSTTLDVTVNNAPNAVAGADAPTLCENETLNLNASGGTLYSWTGPDGFTSSEQNPVLDNINNSQAGDYTVLVTDSAGCSATATVSISITASPELTITASQDASCPGSSDGSATVEASGGVAPYSYLWTPGNFDTPAVNELSAGTYLIEVTDANGCSGNIEVIINESSELSITSTITDANCAESNGAINLSVSGGTGTYTYTWSPDFGDTPDLTNLGAGTYGVTISDGVCEISETFIVDVIGTLDVSIEPNEGTIILGASINLETIITGNIPNASFSWTPQNSLSCSDCPDPIASPSETTTYTVFVTSEDGCSGTASITITVEIECGEAFMPTIFSPNDDFLNDRLCLLGNCIIDSKFTIFNRWGELVFTSNGPDECWNGFFRGKPAPLGVYAFVYEITLVDGTTKEGSGTVTLVK